MTAIDLGPSVGDAFGIALVARFEGRRADVVVERDDGFVDVDPSTYLGEVADDDPTWAWIRDRLGHRVLDIGAGGGRAAVPLQRAGHDIVALDVSPGALEVCARRGVQQRFHGVVTELADTGADRFDSFLCMGNNLGLLGSRAAAPSFFDALRRLGGPECRLLGTMLDPYNTDSPAHLRYHEANRAAGRPSGQTHIRVRYRHLATEWFDLLWLSPDELTDVAQASAWQVIDVLPGGIYAAELRPA